MIVKIHNNLKKQSTIMDVNIEIKFINEILKLDRREVAENETIFFEILEILSTSHTQSIFEINETNIKKFRKLSNWIRSWKREFKSKENLLEVIALNMEAIFY